VQAALKLQLRDDTYINMYHRGLIVNEKYQLRHNIPLTMGKIEVYLY